MGQRPFLIFYNHCIRQCLDHRFFNKCLWTITIRIRELNTGFQTMSKQLAEGKRPCGLRLHPTGLCPKYTLESITFLTLYSGIVCVQDFAGVKGRILVLKETLKTTKLNP